MVRLVASKTGSGKHGLQQFQFQYGAIGRRYNCGYNPHDAKFQFQYGAIGSPSILCDSAQIPIFQFQYGAIGSSCASINVSSSSPISIPVWCDW